MVSENPRRLATVPAGLIAAFVFLIAPSVRPCAAEELYDYIERVAQLAWCDGASYYRLSKDGSFTLYPMGISGREISGRWTYDLGTSQVRIMGKWGWRNGVSPGDDYRFMALDVRIPSEPPDAKGMSRPYFLVDEVRKVTSTEYTQWLAGNDIKPDKP